MNTRRVIMLLALVGLSAWLYLRPGATASVSEFSGATMGTTYRVVLGKARPASDVDALQRDVDSVLVAVNASMSTYDPASELSRFNAREHHEPMVLSGPLATVMQQSLDVYAATDGRFDVTVGPLVDAWGFGPVARGTRVPADSELDSLRLLVGSDKLLLRGDTLQKLHPRVRVDLSAIAKGYGVDRVSELLAQRGAPDHLVEIGGEMRARGRNLRGEPFRVGIEEPDPDRVRVRLAVLLEDRALASSGNYRNFYEQDGVRYVHTLDPVAGRPVRHTLLAVSVLHEQCALADAWATALLAAGPELGRALAQRNALDVMLLITGDQGEVIEQFTGNFERAVRRSQP